MIFIISPRNECSRLIAHNRGLSDAEWQHLLTAEQLKGFNSDRAVIWKLPVTYGQWRGSEVARILAIAEQRGIEVINLRGEK